MSKLPEVPKSGPNSDVPQTKIGKQLTGEDYRESLLTQAKLEKALGTNTLRKMRIYTEVLMWLYFGCNVVIKWY